MAFDQAKADEICERVARGEPLAQVCRSPGMPKVRTVYDWQDAHPSFAASIARAREIGYDMIAQEALDIANTPIEGEITRIKPDGTEITREDMLGHRRLQVDTRLKLLAKWDPKRYGDRTHHDVDATVRVEIADPAKQLRGK